MSNLDYPPCSPLERTIPEPAPDADMATKAAYWKARVERSRGTRDYHYALEKFRIFSRLAKTSAYGAAVDLPSARVAALSRPAEQPNEPGNLSPTRAAPEQSAGSSKSSSSGVTPRNVAMGAGPSNPAELPDSKSGEPRGDQRGLETGRAYFCSWCRGYGDCLICGNHGAVG